MFHWFRPNQNKTRSLLKRPRTVLQMELLERRDCPSAQPITPDASGSFPAPENIYPLETVCTTAPDPGGTVSNTAPATPNPLGASLCVFVAQGPNRTVTVTGQVFGNSPGGLAVTLSGVVSGSMTTDANGMFTYTGTASAAGQIHATVTDAWGVTASSSTTLLNLPPIIINFQAINNGNNTWTFIGQVQDEYATGLVVRLSGIPSLDNNNASATVQANGAFSYTISLQPGENGSVTAECIDLWGQSSTEATAFVWN
jgi:hypothetical protein